jgi:general nucleoside transport system permease protein
MALATSDALAQSMSDAPSAIANQATRIAEAVLIPLVALTAALLLFGLFMLFIGKNPFDVYALIYKGGFGSAFSWQNTLQRAAPLILTALCVALPAQAGLIVIGGEGALVLGALAAAIVGHSVGELAPMAGLVLMALGAMCVGGIWIAACGALRHYRGVNETISSLLMAYIAIALFNHFVEGMLRDPQSLNKPSTLPIPASHMLGNIPGYDVHWGLIIGIVACLIFHVWVRQTVQGFALRIVGGNVRAARLAGLPVGRLVLTACFAGGAMAGLAGMVEVAAVHGSANASLIAGYGYTGILVAFIARQNPVTIIPVALLLGGINASGGMLQRRLDLPDATVLVLQGIAFMMVLASETLYGRFKVFQPRER